MKKATRFWPFFLLLSAAAVVLYLLLGNPFISYHNKQLSQSIQSVSAEAEQVYFNELVPFEWDEVYQFPPYTTKETMEETIRLHSRAIGETVSEGMVQLIFVDGGKEKVVASICAYPQVIGYSIALPYNYGDYGKIRYDDAAVFQKSMVDGILYFTYLESPGAV